MVKPWAFHVRQTWKVTLGQVSEPLSASVSSFLMGTIRAVVMPEYGRDYKVHNPECGHMANTKNMSALMAWREKWR